MQKRAVFRKFSQKWTAPLPRGARRWGPREGVAEEVLQRGVVRLLLELHLAAVVQVGAHLRGEAHAEVLDLRAAVGLGNGAVGRAGRCTLVDTCDSTLCGCNYLDMGPKRQL